MKIFLKTDKCVFDQDSSGTSNAHSNKLRHIGEGRGIIMRNSEMDPGQKMKRLHSRHGPGTRALSRAQVYLPSRIRASREVDCRPDSTVSPGSKQCLTQSRKQMRLRVVGGGKANK